MVNLELRIETSPNGRNIGAKGRKMDIYEEYPNLCSTLEVPSSPMICVNCCTPILEYPNTENIYNIEIGSDTLRISALLGKIYHINCLKKSINGEEDALPEDSALCLTCANVLAHLGKFFGELEKLRHAESILTKKIFKLCEIIEEGLKNYDHPHGVPETTVDRIKTEPRDTEEVVVNVDPYSNTTPKGPWVRLKRLRPEEIATGVTDTSKDPQDNSDRSFLDDDGSRNDPDLNFFEDSGMDRSDEEFPLKRKKNIRKTPRKKRNTRVKNARPSRECKRTSQSKIKFHSEDSVASGGDHSVEYGSTSEGVSDSAGDFKFNKRKRIFKPNHGRFYELFYRRQMVHPYPCVYCEADFDTETERAEHLRSTHVSTAKPEFCAKCGKIFSDESRKKSHEPKCGTIPPGVHLPPYTCTQCNKEYPSWSKLSTHTRQVHVAERRFACDQCSYRTIAPSLLENHRQRVHTVTAEVQCPECGKVLKSQELYLSHFDRMHGQGHELYKQQLIKSSQRRRERRKPPLTSFVCTDCNVDFLTKNRLTNHRLAVHETEKKHMCDQCGKSFINPGRLRKHIEYTHTDERPFICDQCGKNFKSMDNLKCHIVRSHTEEGRLKYNEYTRRKNRHRQLVAIAQSSLNNSPLVFPDGSAGNEFPSNASDIVQQSPDTLTQLITTNSADLLVHTFQHSN